MARPRFFCTSCTERSLKASIISLWTGWTSRVVSEPAGCISHKFASLFPNQHLWRKAPWERLPTAQRHQRNGIRLQNADNPARQLEPLCTSKPLRNRSNCLSCSSSSHSPKARQVALGWMERNDLRWKLLHRSKKTIRYHNLARSEKKSHNYQAYPWLSRWLAIVSLWNLQLWRLYHGHNAGTALALNMLQMNCFCPISQIMRYFRWTAKDFGNRRQKPAQRIACKVTRLNRTSLKYKSTQKLNEFLKSHWLGCPHCPRTDGCGRA